MNPIPLLTFFHFREFFWCLVVAISLVSSHAATVFYTYGGSSGGVAELAVDPATGGIVSHDSLGEVPFPEKLAVSADGTRVIVTSEKEKAAWIYRIAPIPGLLATLPLDGETSEVQAIGDRALLLAGKGFFYWIDLKAGKIDKTWNARTGLHPSGNKGEDIFFLPEKVLVSFQKDSKEGKHKGGRVVLLDLKGFTVKGDLQLPRDYPDLHIEGNKKEQGPCPEMLFVAPKSNTLAISLDLYGAIAFADLDDALRGHLKNLSYIPSSPDGAWGTAFPDRGLLFEAGGKEYLLIANASENGGLVLFDVAQRKIVQSFGAEAGTETPVLLPELKKAVTVISGKAKKRAADGLEKETTPGNTLLVFDLAPLESGDKATLERVPFDCPVVRAQAIAPGNSDLLLLVTGDNEFVTYDLEARKELAREPAKGEVVRMAPGWRKQ